LHVPSLQALDYKARISAAVPPGCAFSPLMTLYLTDNTSADDVAAAAAAGIVAYKLYPAGATTNSGRQGGWGQLYVLLLRGACLHMVSFANRQRICGCLTAFLRAAAAAGPIV
jgi:hypothetical protein